MFKFVASLEEDSDLVAVLRGHLYIEATLTQLIARHYPGADDVLIELAYLSKIRMARRRNLIDSDLARALQALGNVRDSFAHLPVKAALTPEDDLTMTDAIRGNFLTLAFNRRKEGGYEGVGGATRTAMLAIFGVLFTEAIPFDEWVYLPGMEPPDLYADD